MTLPRLVCATANPGKVAEIAALLDGLVELAPRPQGVPDVVEDADRRATGGEDTGQGAGS